LEVTRLRTLVKGRDYGAVMKEVTPAFFQRGLRDKAARPALLLVERSLFREAERLLRRGEYQAAKKLLDKVVRFAGPLKSSAEKLKKAAMLKATTKPRGSGVAAARPSRGKGKVVKTTTKKLKKKNGGGRMAMKPSRAASAGPRKGAKKAAKKVEKKPAKTAKAAEKKVAKAAKRPKAAAPKPIVKPDHAGKAGTLDEEEYYRKGLEDEEYQGEEEEEEEPESVSVVEEELEIEPQPTQGGNGHGDAGGGGGTASGGGDGERRGIEVKEQTEVLRRTPHMDLSTGDAPLAPGAEFQVYVSVDTQAAKPGEESQQIELEGPASQEEFPVEVTLVVSGHFQSPESGTQPMTILRSGETAPVVFDVRCQAQFPAEEDGALSALFKYQGHPSGRVTRRLKLENGKLVLVPPLAAQSLAPAATGAAAAVQTPAVPVGLQAKVAAVSGLDPYDLTISVIDTGENDCRHFRLMVDSPPTGKQVDVLWTLGDKTDQIVRNYMNKFVAKGLKPTTRLAELKGAGVQLFGATPKEFQKLFWELIDSGKPPKTIMVVSDEPYLPWELMVPRRTVAGKLETRSPLGVEFCVGCWVRMDYTSAPQQIHLDKTYVVAPKYVDPNKNLKFAPQEAAFVYSSFKPSEQIDPAEIDKINDALRDKGATLLHFVCHGAAGTGTDQTIYLQDMVNNLSSSAVDGLDGFTMGFPRDHTFVFLNACEVGRTTPALVGIGGFASTFLKLGASGVVAALWSVKDDLAHEVAEKFYRRVIAEPETAFAEIMRDIRTQAYSGNAEDTYAAYCFYGSPLAKRKK
jgi:hypothetical protein